MTITPKKLSALRSDVIDLLNTLNGLYTTGTELDLDFAQPSSIYHNVVATEMAKMEDLAMTVAVIGTMKAGKSTLLNAILGEELLPSRELGMTAIPTMIHRVAKLDQPRLVIPKPESFQQTAAQLRAKLASEGPEFTEKLLGAVGEKDSKRVKQHLLGEAPYTFDEKNGILEVRECLALLNDLLRLAQQPEVNIPPPTDSFETYRDFPRLDIPDDSAPAEDPNVDSGKVIFVDTPGQNEAGAMNLATIVQQQLQTASALILVLNYEQLNEKEAALLQSQVMLEVNDYTDRLHVVVNRFDTQDDRSMSSDQVKRFVASRLFRDIDLPEDRVYPVSSRNALWAKRAIAYLDADGLPDATQSSWVPYFGRAFLGELWEEDLENHDRVRKSAVKGLQSSRFETLEERVVKDAFSNVSIRILTSAFSRIRKYAGEPSDLSAMVATKTNETRDQIKQAKAAISEMDHLLEKLPTFGDQATGYQREELKNFDTALSTKKTQLLSEIKLSKLATSADNSNQEKSIDILLQLLKELFKGFDSRKDDDLQSDLKEKTTEAKKLILLFWNDQLKHFSDAIDTQAADTQLQLTEKIDPLLAPYQQAITAIGDPSATKPKLSKFSLAKFPQAASELEREDFSKEVTRIEEKTRTEKRSRKILGWQLPDSLPDIFLFKKSYQVTDSWLRFDPEGLEKWCNEQIQEWLDSKLSIYQADIDQIFTDYRAENQAKLNDWQTQFQDNKDQQHQQMEKLQQYSQSLQQLQEQRIALVSKMEKFEKGIGLNKTDSN